MKIGRLSQTTSASPRRTGSKPSGEAFRLPSTATPGGPETAGVAASGPLAAIEGLLAVQESETTDGYSGRRARAIAQGHDILDVLDQVRLDLMMGGVPKSKLEALVRLVERNKDALPDSRLSAVLDEIELRAQVEIAKMEMALK